jgi:hypothetical protein
LNDRQYPQATALSFGEVSLAGPYIHATDEGKGAAIAQLQIMAGEIATGLPQNNAADFTASGS